MLSSKPRLLPSIIASEWEIPHSDIATLTSNGAAGLIVVTSLSFAGLPVLVFSKPGTPLLCVLSEILLNRGPAPPLSGKLKRRRSGLSCCTPGRPARWRPASGAAGCALCPISHPDAALPPCAVVARRPTPTPSTGNHEINRPPGSLVSHLSQVRDINLAQVSNMKISVWGTATGCHCHLRAPRSPAHGATRLTHWSSTVFPVVSSFLASFSALPSPTRTSSFSVY